MIPVSIADLRLALGRVRRDHIDQRVFVNNPIERALVQLCEAEWLASLRKALADGSYTAIPSTICDVPKGRGGVRPGTILSLADQVVYTACIGKCVRPLLPMLRYGKKSKDCAYQLADIKGVKWLKLRFGCWEDFRSRSLNALDTGANAVVSTDITAFYDNIALNVLASDLRDAAVPEALVKLISECLNRWSMIKGRGIPQGLSASDFLAKVYLARVDQALADLGYSHLRYVDDIRIFCSDRGEAKRALFDRSILRWWAGGHQAPSTNVVAYARKAYRATDSPSYLRSAARLLLARYGSAADLDHLENSYSSSSSDVERAEILCAIYRMEKTHRNAFLKEAEKDGLLAAQAVKFVKQDGLHQLFVAEG